MNLCTWKRKDAQKKDVIRIFFIKFHFDVFMPGAQKQSLKYSMCELIPILYTMRIK